MVLLWQKTKDYYKKFLKDKNKIGFDGLVMSDWWAINSDSYEYFANGCDMNMRGGTKETGTMTGKDGS